ncbi:hypothetical protein PHLGIDRAFT_298768 [Phlebiopsis gigantea 11061_1 CR5-6]|uniref:Secreted protein n=1 Tax=Phlebiopsis gigantea (strain 11061_1 CR5-6) TaxID=745531 RepID=A0A0C3NCV4_PHLG1|nr:hypothetical protein PHLGIDRAFT_298768 [Phlebiopsis gigantea 11061_1 CR5-6]
MMRCPCRTGRPRLMTSPSIVCACLLVCTTVEVARTVGYISCKTPDEHFAALESMFARERSVLVAVMCYGCTPRGLDEPEPTQDSASTPSHRTPSPRPHPTSSRVRTHWQRFPIIAVDRGRGNKDWRLPTCRRPIISMRQLTRHGFISTRSRTIPPYGGLEEYGWALHVVLD